MAFKGEKEETILIYKMLRSKIDYDNDDKSEQSY